MEYKFVDVLGVVLRIPTEFYKTNFIKSWRKKDNKWITKSPNPTIYFKDFQTKETFSYILGSYPVSKPFDIDKIYDINNKKINRLICESYNYGEENILDIRYGIIRNYK